MSKKKEIKISNLLNVYRSIKKIGWKKTKEKWYYNYVMLETPEQLLRKEIYGYIGTIGGLLIAIVIFISRGLWYVCIAMAFSLLIMYSKLKGTLKQQQELKDIEEQFQEQTEDEIMDEEKEELKDGIELTAEKEIQSPSEEES